MSSDSVAMCEDPPSFFESPSPPGTPPPLKVNAGEGVAGIGDGRSHNLQAETYSPESSERRLKMVTLSQQLKSVSIKKLSLNKGNIAGLAAKPLDITHFSEEQREAQENERKAKRLKVDDLPHVSSEKEAKRGGIMTPVTVGNAPSSPSPLQHKRKVDLNTPVQSRRALTTSRGRGESVTKPTGVGEEAIPSDAADTPPLPSVHSRLQLGTTRLPASDCKAAGKSAEPSKPPRRNLSLSYSRKLGSSRKKIVEAHDSKPGVCDETIEIDTTVFEAGPFATPVRKALKVVRKKVQMDGPPPSCVAQKADSPVTMKETDPTTGEKVNRGLNSAEHATKPPRKSGGIAGDMSTLGDGGSDDYIDLSHYEDDEDIQESRDQSPTDASPKLRAKHSTSSAKGDVQGDHVNEHQSKRTKINNLGLRNVSNKAKKSDSARREDRNHPPPPLYAHGGISTSKYSKLILSSFNSYFSQLATAQSQVLCRVQWGEPIKCGSKPSARRGRSSRRLDSHVKYSLKLGTRPRPGFDSGNEFDFLSATPAVCPVEKEATLHRQLSDGGLGTCRKTPEAEEDLEVDVECKLHSDVTLPGTSTADFSPESPDVTAGDANNVADVIDADDAHDVDEGMDAIPTSKQEKREGSDDITIDDFMFGEEERELEEDKMDGVDSNSSHDAIIISTQDHSSSARGAPSSSHNGHASPEPPEAEADSLIPYHISSTPSPPKEPPNNPVPLDTQPDTKEESSWLSSRKPPPQIAKKARKKATPRSKPVKAKAAAKKTEKIKRRGKSAAARLIQSKIQSSSSDSDAADQGRGDESVSRSHWDSSSGEDSDVEVKGHKPKGTAGKSTSTKR